MNAAEIVPGTVQIRAPQPLTRMRFAHQCVSELRKLDPSCPITETFIRSLVKRGLAGWSTSTICCVICPVRPSSRPAPLVRQVSGVSRNKVVTCLAQWKLHLHP